MSAKFRPDQKVDTVFYNFCALFLVHYPDSDMAVAHRDCQLSYLKILV